MKINKTYRIFALSMSLLLLLSSIGFSADFHFCQGEFKNLALFTKAKSCHEIAAMHASCHGGKNKPSSCHKSELKNSEVSCTGDEEEDGCCTNNTELMQLDVDYSFHGQAAENLIDLYDDLAILTSNPRIEFSTFAFPSQYQNYKPPLLVENLRVRFQSFLC